MEGLLLLFSLGCFIVGMARLVADRQWTIIARYFICLGVYLGICRAVWEISDDELKMWMAVPLLMLFPGWLLSGILVFRASEGHGFLKPLPGARPTWSPRIPRWVGMICLLWGVGSFFYGLIYPPNLHETAIPLLFTYLPLLYGAHRLHAYTN